MNKTKTSSQFLQTVKHQLRCPVKFKENDAAGKALSDVSETDKFFFQLTHYLVMNGLHINITSVCLAHIFFQQAD